MFGSSIITKGKGAALTKYGSEIERTLAPYLYDDSVQVMTSFEMNKVASLTYGEECCDQIYDLLGTTLSKSTESTVLTLQKTLVLMRHLTIYGSDESVENAFGNGHLVRRLLDYNTVLQGNSANNIFNQIKGGSVDKGGPVRKAAKDLHDILASKEKLYQLRRESADPNSLVPVGKKDEIAFQSASHAKKTVTHPKKAKSNLAKEKNGFGSGFNPRDALGRVVVGAAHSLEEMLAAAEREKTQYCDDVSDPKYQRRQEQLKMEKEKKQKSRKKQFEATTPDLLDLDFNPASNPPPHNSITSTTSVFDVFDTPNEGVSTYGTDDNLLLKLKMQEEEIERLRKEKEHSMMPATNNNSVGSFGLGNTTTNVLASNSNQNIMGASSSSASAISSIDVLAPAPSDFAPNLSSTFDALSININSIVPPVDAPPPLSSFPDVVAPAPSHLPMNPSSTFDALSMNANIAPPIDAPPPVPSFPDVIAPAPMDLPPIPSAYPEPYRETNNYAEGYVKDGQPVHGGHFSGASPMGGNSLANPLQQSYDNYGTSQVPSTMTPTFYTSNTSEFTLNTTNPMSSNVGTTEPNAMTNNFDLQRTPISTGMANKMNPAGIGVPNPIMNNLNLQETSNGIDGQTGDMNPILYQMMINAKMMTPEQQQFFIQQQQMMMMAMMSPQSMGVNNSVNDMNNNQSKNPEQTKNSANPFGSM